MCGCVGVWVCGCVCVWGCVCVCVCETLASLKRHWTSNEGLLVLFWYQLKEANFTRPILQS